MLIRDCRPKRSTLAETNQRLQTMNLTLLPSEQEEYIR